jgi:choline dehydrogenase
MDAATSTICEWQPDSNAPGSTGCGYYAYNSRDGVRVSTNDGYLEPARDRSNLTIRGGVTVDQILFDRAGRAVGVRALGPDGVEQITAGEVILSAGTVASPAILVRSGIGPAATVRDLGLPVVSDLPVGHGVQDHAILSLRFPMDPNGQQGIYRPVVCLRYSSGSADGGFNDMFLGVSGPMGPELQIGTFMPWLNMPLSRGTLTCHSLDPQVQPRVDIRILSDERDVVRLLGAVDRAASLSRHPAFEKVLAGPIVGPDGTTLGELLGFSRSELSAYALRYTRDCAHLTSTCRMGDPARSTTVVDASGRVLGVEGLRVADASIFPAVTRANTGLATVAVAEKLADAIKAGR